MTTLYKPRLLPDRFALCEHHALAPMISAAQIWEVDLSGDETTQDVIVLVEAKRALEGQTEDMMVTVEGECIHCEAGVE